MNSGIHFLCFHKYTWYASKEGRCWDQRIWFIKTNNYRHIGQPFCVLSPQVGPPPALLSASPLHTFHLKCNKFWTELLQWPRCEPMSVRDLVFNPPTFSIWCYSGQAVLVPRSQNSRCCGAVSNSLCCVRTGSQHGEATGSAAGLLVNCNGEGIPAFWSLQLRATSCTYPYPVTIWNVLKSVIYLQ